MRKEDEYLREAEDAQKWAERSKTEKAKAVWLRIAASWMGLVRGTSAEKDEVEALAGERPTHRRQSEQSAVAAALTHSWAGTIDRLRPLSIISLDAD